MTHPIGYRAIVGILAVLWSVGACADPDALSVRTLGARGDGLSDDTAAFMRAVARARSEKRAVYVPRGVYRIAKPIVLENAAVVGPDGGAWPADTDAMPVLIPLHRDGPCVELKAGGSLKGVCIRYEWSKEPPAGPPAVLVSGIGASISAVKLMYPWDGIVTDGVSNVGRLNVSDVFIVSPRNVGVRVTGTWDVPALRNVEVWNAGPVPRPLEKGVGFDLGKNDLIRLTDCFAFAMGTGFLLREKIPGCKIEGGTWGVMTGCATDFCGVGIEVRGEHTLSISGGTFWQHHQSLIVDGGKARIRLSGAELKSNGAPAVEVRDSDHVVVTGCSLLRPMKEHNAPCLLLTGGRTVVQGCHIQAEGPGIVIGEKAREAAVTGNTTDTTGPPIEDRRKQQR
jgi:hypothetical protein